MKLLRRKYLHSHRDIGDKVLAPTSFIYSKNFIVSVKRQKKKGQLLAQPLVYIFAVIVGGLIMFFGYLWIQDLMNAGCATGIKKWSSEFDSKVKELSFLDVGSTTVIPISLPNQVKYVCIRSADKVTSFPEYVEPQDRTLINANVGKTLMMLPTTACKANTFAEVKNLQAASGFQCFQNGARMKLSVVDGGKVQAS